MTARLIYKCRLVGLFHIMLTIDISQRYIFTDRLLHVMPNGGMKLLYVQTTIHTVLL